tara:strand:+ start:808 stop:1044 length:237 start_codon:yes stop_codon:yes gene_type:complete
VRIVERPHKNISGFFRKGKNMETFTNWLHRILGRPIPKDLNKMNKRELEALGREHGIELDRRFKREKLVKQLRIKLGV